MIVKVHNIREQFYMSYISLLKKLGKRFRKFYKET